MGAKQQVSHVCCMLHTQIMERLGNYYLHQTLAGSVGVPNITGCTERLMSKAPVQIGYNIRRHVHMYADWLCMTDYLIFWCRNYNKSGTLSSVSP